MSMVYVEVRDKNSDALPSKNRINEMAKKLKERGHEVFIGYTQEKETSYFLGVTSKKSFDKINIHDDISRIAGGLDLSVDTMESRMLVKF